MSTFTLKIIALILMTIDHIGLFIPNMPIGLRWLGRLAAPIFLFCLLNGIEKTSNKKKYLLRMYLFSNAVEVMNLIVNKCTTGDMSLTSNIFAVYFPVLLSAYLLEKSKEQNGNYKKGIRNILLWQVTAMLILCATVVLVEVESNVIYLLASFMGCIWGRGYEAVLAVLGILLYVFRKDKWKFSICYSSISILISVFTVTSFWSRVIARLYYYTSSLFSDICLGILGTFISGFGFETIRIREIALSDFLFYDYQWMMIFALPFAFLYNGKQGRKVKWSFYLYYPLHILVLFLIGSTMTAG